VKSAHAAVLSEVAIGHFDYDEVYSTREDVSAATIFAHTSPLTCPWRRFWAMGCAPPISRRLTVRGVTPASSVRVSSANEFCSGLDHKLGTKPCAQSYRTLVCKFDCSRKQFEPENSCGGKELVHAGGVPTW